MSCEFCEKADFGRFRAEVEGNYAHISLAGGSSRFPKQEQFAFCPMCGESLAEQEPLTLEELKVMHNDVAWIKDACGIIPVIIDARYRERAANVENVWPFEYYGAQKDFEDYDWWLAYRRQPKEETVDDKD